jgi:hypothetical protein
MGKMIKDTVNRFCEEVKLNEFPSPDNIFTINEKDFEKSFPEVLSNQQRKVKKLNIGIVGKFNFNSLVVEV